MAVHAAVAVHLAYQLNLQCSGVAFSQRRCQHFHSDDAMAEFAGVDFHSDDLCATEFLIVRNHDVER